MSASHTPGPYRHEPDQTNIETDTANVGCISADYCLALVFADGGIGKERALANAHLFKAAPELLKALERIVADYQTKSLVISHEAITGAIAAVAKARGDAS